MMKMTVYDYIDAKLPPLEDQGEGIILSVTSQLTARDLGNHSGYNTLIFNELLCNDIMSVLGYMAYQRLIFECRFLVKLNLMKQYDYYSLMETWCEVLFKKVYCNVVMQSVQFT